MECRWRRVALVAVVALGLVVAAAPVPPAAADGFTVVVEHDVVYGQGEVDGGGTFADLELDLYTPQGSGQTTFPLVVMVHGGGFFAGDKGTPRLVAWARAAAERGFLVASINYRLVRDDPVPSPAFDPLVAAVGGASAPAQSIAAVAAFEDTRTALEFLVARPEVDPGRVALWGSSAGAITSLYVAYALDDFGIAAPPVHAVVDNWGGFAATPGDADALEAGEPPLFIVHGTADPTVPYALTEDIVARAGQFGHHYVLHSIPGGGHGVNLATTEFVPGVSLQDAQLDWLDRVVADGAGCADPFYDVGAWIEPAAEWAYCGPYLTGYPDHTFRPTRPITRGEAARLLYRVAGRPDVEGLDHGLGDVPAWVDDAVTWLVTEGHATGYRDGTFRAGSPITRGELTRMQFRIAGSPTGSPPHGFDDVAPWLEEAVRWIADPGRDPQYATGYGNGTYRPERAITRAETVRMTCRIDGTVAC